MNLDRETSLANVGSGFKVVQYISAQSWFSGRRACSSNFDPNICQTQLQPEWH